MAVSLRDHPLFDDANLDAYWEFRNRVNDSIGNNGGTSSPSYADGLYGRALASTTNIVTNALKYTGDFSIYTLIYCASASDSSVFLQNAIVVAGDYSGFNFFCGGSNAVPRMETYYANGSPSVDTVTSASAMIVGAWNRVWYTKSGTTGKIYINGVETASGTNRNPSYDATHTPVITPNNSALFDESAVFGRTITAAEILNFQNYSINRLQQYRRTRFPGNIVRIPK